MKSLKFEVFGRRVLITKFKGAWAAFYLGEEGKRRPAIDIILPPGITESEMQQYLGDLSHEWATEQYPIVKRLY